MQNLNSHINKVVTRLSSVLINKSVFWKSLKRLDLSILLNGLRLRGSAPGVRIVLTTRNKPNITTTVLGYRSHCKLTVWFSSI